MSASLSRYHSSVAATWLNELVTQVAVQQFVRRNFTLDAGSFAWFGDLGLQPLFFALLLLVIAGVFRGGTELQEEHDATI